MNHCGYDHRTCTDAFSGCTTNLQSYSHRIARRLSIPERQYRGISCQASSYSGRPASVPDERDARCTQILHYFLNAYSLISPLALFHAIDVNGNLHLGMVKRDDVHLVVEHR